ncbi:hypothetical protein IAU60_001725 [Kwoniella sp. DSM 27419]
MDNQAGERRSDAEFQQFLDDFVGDQKTVLTGNLPDLLANYERDHDIHILDDGDSAGVRILCDQYPDLELGPTELFGFLQAVLSRSQPPSSPPALSPKVDPEPVSKQLRKLAESTPDQPIYRRRRHSDRVRSPSDSSGSSSSEDEDDVSKRSDRQRSAPPQGGKAFPATGIGSAPPPPGGWLPIRKKTISESNSSDTSLSSPLTLRARGPPPSAFGGFARPSPASRRRRGSSGAYTPSGGSERDRDSPEPSSGRPYTNRSTSSASNASTPGWQRRYDSRPTSPMSPDEIDNTSYHERAKSPDSMPDEDPDQAEMDTFVPAGQHDPELADHEVEEVDDDVVEQAMRIGGTTMNARLSRISTESSNSLRTSHDTVAKLRKENADLIRKLKETERLLAVQGAENERLHEDLQIKLEEAQAEITQRRKDEKDLKGKDRAQVIQISGFEADILSLQRSLENSKANHASMQKMYNAQCDEAQRLRDLLRDRDEEIRGLEESLQTHTADEEKLSREVHALEAEVKRLESDISVAREAESHLERQKQENLALKETIDRMRFDLEEARAVAVTTGRSGHTAAASGSSGMPTLSRNLGNEISRRLMEAEMTHQEESDEGDSSVETIVTTQRTRKKGTRTSTSQGDASSQEQPILRIEESIREYADAQTETDPVSEEGQAQESALASRGNGHDLESASPPAYTPKPEPLSKAQILEHAHPKTLGHDMDVEEEYNIIVDALGMRCTVFEEELEAKRTEMTKRGVSRSPGVNGKTYRPEQHEQYRSGIVNYIFYNSGNSVRDQVSKLAVYVVAAFAVGLVAGSSWLGTPVGMNPRDYQLFTQMNTLAGVAGAGEGFLPISMLGVVEQGARMIAGTAVAGRIPT